MPEFTVDRMLSNAAVASQNISLLDDPVTRGAILRPIRQWLELTHYDVDDAMKELSNHPDFDA